MRLFEDMTYYLTPVFVGIALALMPLLLVSR